MAQSSIAYVSLPSISCPTIGIAHPCWVHGYRRHLPRNTLVEKLSVVYESSQLPAALFSCCIRCSNEALTLFQAARYLSMHMVTQELSPLERLDPGLVTHFSKQCSLTFCSREKMLVPGLLWGSRRREGSCLEELPRVGDVALGLDLADDRLLDRRGVHGFG